MKRHWSKLLGAGMIAAVLLTACNDDNVPAGEAARGLTYATAKDINDINPHLYAGSMPAQGMVFESLVENTEAGIQPLLAESWDISEDGKVYTFRLRQGVTFHDGEPFNAEAAKRNIEAVQSNAAKHAWIKLSAKIADVRAIDEYTLALVLSEPYYPTLLELSMTRPYVFLSPRDLIDGESKNGVDGYHGTGPYRLAEHKADRYAIFEANDEYWGGAPKLDTITAKVLPAGETTYLALRSGEVDFVFTDDRGADGIDADAMQSLADSGDYRLTRSKPMNTKMIVANSGNSASPVSEKAVREAIWHAIDRGAIAERIMGGAETPAETLFSPNVNYADVPLEPRAFDSDKANKLLEEAGWKHENGKKSRSRDGKALAAKLYYDSNSPSQKTQAEFIQSSLSTIGMELALVGEESASIANRRASGDYELLFNQTWGLAYDPQSTIAAFTSEAAYLHTTEGIPDAQALYRNIERVMVTMDEAERRSLYADILETVHDEAVFIPLTNGGVTIVAPANLQGVAFKQTQFELPFERMYYE
ncbi:staphylopine-dependent metal ABC transporter substrate-binding lipoprotein [Cohnella sp. GCM10027633]|uniref:staphylopine-dependent metal ABC transporter substrate-binding lipoprotein n=1 Tax=unclassified Cohnella TaxID=2636738 RepID=UPI0036328FEE